MSSGSSFETERNLSQTDALVMLRLGDLERTGISSRCVRLLGSAWRSSRRPAAPRNGRRGPDKQSACLLASDSRARLPRQPSRERNGTGNGGRGNYARDPARLAVARFRFPRLGLAVSGGWQPPPRAWTRWVFRRAALPTWKKWARDDVGPTPRTNNKSTGASAYFADRTLVTLVPAEHVLVCACGLYLLDLACVWSRSNTRCAGETFVRIHSATSY